MTPSTPSSRAPYEPRNLWQLISWSRLRCRSNEGNFKVFKWKTMGRYWIEWFYGAVMGTYSYMGQYDIKYWKFNSVYNPCQTKRLASGCKSWNPKQRWSSSNLTRRQQWSRNPSIAVTSRNSLVWTVLHIKYNMESKREDPKMLQTQNQVHNLNQRFPKIPWNWEGWQARKPDLLVFLPLFSKQGNPLLAVTPPKSSAATRVGQHYMIVWHAAIAMGIHPENSFEIEALHEYHGARLSNITEKNS